MTKTTDYFSAEQNPDKNFVFPELCFTMDTGTGYTDDEDDDEDALTKGGGRCVAAAAKADGSKDNMDDDGGDEMEEGAGEAATDGDGAPLPEAAAETKDPDARGDANGQGEEGEVCTYTLIYCLKLNFCLLKIGNFRQHLVPGNHSSDLFFFTLSLKTFQV